MKELSYRTESRVEMLNYHIRVISSKGIMKNFTNIPHEFETVEVSINVSRCTEIKHTSLLMIGSKID